MARTVNTNPANPSPENSNNEWTTIPVKPKLLVSFPKYPTEPTKHILILNSHFAAGTDKWIWHCYLDDEILAPNPRGRERYLGIQKAFIKSGNFFAQRGIVLHSLNISTAHVVELFFGSEEDVWKADALVQEYSQAMTGVGDRIRIMENTGKMVCHGVHLPEEYTSRFVGRWNLKEERLRKLEDMNPVFYSTGKRWLYRIRCVHYMSSRAPKEQLARTGETWAVTFSDFRVAECFIVGDAEFNFFVGPCAGGLKWYQENPHRFFPNPSRFWKGLGSSNGSGTVSGAVESSTTEANNRLEKRVEGLVLSENPEQAKSTLDVGVCVTEQKKLEDEVLASPLEQAGSPPNVKVAGTEQQESEVQSITTAAIGQVLHTVTTDGLEQAVVTKKSEVQAPINAFTKQATNTAVRINTTEQQKSQPLQHLAKNAPTPTSINSAGDKATPSIEGAKRQRTGAKGAKITPPAKEPTSGNTGNKSSVSASPISTLVTPTTTTTRGNRSYRQHRQPNPRQSTNHGPSDNIAATTTNVALTVGVSAGKGETTTASVDTPQLKDENMPPSEATEKRRQTKSAKKKKPGKKRADKKSAAAGAATGGGEGEMKVDKVVAQGVVAG